MMRLMKKRADIVRTDNVPMPPPDPALADHIANANESIACLVCGARGTVRKEDQLCWVCRRLKISAWRDVEKLGAPE